MIHPKPQPKRPTPRQRQKYRASAKWRRLRLRVLRRDNYTCRYCFENGRPGNELTVHHLTYERFGGEKMEDLVTACKDCHGNRELEKRLGKGEIPPSLERVFSGE